MAYHNETCGCAECGNYGQTYNPSAIHNQSCGCAECGNYPQTSRAGGKATLSAPGVEMVAVPVELLDEVRALIARRVAAIEAATARKPRTTVASQTKKRKATATRIAKKT